MAARPALQPARGSGSSSQTVGAAGAGGDGARSSSNTVTGQSTPSDDDASSAYFHSAASTIAGSGSHYQQQQQHHQDGQQQQEGDETSALEAHIQRMELSEGDSADASSSRHARDPARAAPSNDDDQEAARARQEDADGVVRTDFAADSVFQGNAHEEQQRIGQAVSGEGSSTAHFSVAARSPTSTAPVQQQQQQQHDEQSGSSHQYARNERATTGGPRRASNPFIIQDSSVGSPSSPHGQASSPPSSGQRSSPMQQQGSGTHQNYTSSGPSRSKQHDSYTSQQQAPTASTSGGGQQQQSYTRQQSRAQRSIPTPNIDAAKQDYFSRHPDPDYALRHGNTSSRARERRPRSSSSRTTNTSERASVSGDEEHASHPSAASQDRGEPSGSGMPEALLSPALSVGTLSSGVSVGPSMGGYERIFPIRSVVAGQKPLPQPTPGASSSSSSSKYKQSGKHQSYSPSQQRRPNPAIAASVRSSSSGATALQQSRGQRAPQEAPLHEEAEMGTDYSRRSPIPDDVSDFSFGSAGSARVGEGMHAPPRPHPKMDDDGPLQRGDPASLYGTAENTSPTTERRQDDIFQSSNKPYLHRNDSLISQTTRSSDPAAVSSISAHASSYPTTSRYSDDSDPTARKGTSTAPSTLAGTPGHGSSVVSRRPGLASIESQELGEEEPELHKKGVRFDHNDPTQAAREAYEKGEAEEGPSVESGGLGSLGIEQDGLFLNARFEHQETEDGHMIVTGRKGELLKCEDEPIHIPGAIQDYGVLIAVEENEQGNFIVTQVSEVSDLLQFILASLYP